MDVYSKLDIPKLINTTANAVIDSEKLDISFLENMMRANIFETNLLDLSNRGLVHGTMHLCIGEEAADTCSAMALSDSDYIFATHRNHGIAIGRGLSLNAMMAEILAKKTGTNEGLGGSMHISEPTKGLIGSNGVVGAGTPLAIGAALKIKLKGDKDRVAVSFFGDGAANQGAVLESFNLAGLWKLPIIFILINNSYAVSTAPESASADSDLIKRAMPFKLRPFDIDGDDPREVYYTVKKARDFVTGGGGPVLIVEHTYRLSGHSRSDTNVYRTKEELIEREKCSALRRFGATLINEGRLTKKSITLMWNKAKGEALEAIDFALNSPDSNFSKEDLEKRTYAN